MKSGAQKPLMGKTVVFTRAMDQQGKAREILENLGARVLNLPVLMIGPPSDWGPLDHALSDLESFHWIIFSSANGVEAVERRLQKSGKCLAKIPSNLKIAAIGKQTAELLKTLGAPINFVPPSFIADSLIEYFPVSSQGLKILLPRVQSGGRTVLAKAFGKDGANIVEVAAYESCCPDNIPEETFKAIKSNTVDAIAFTSSKTALHTAQLLNKYFGEDWKNGLEKVELISIGPQTTLTIKELFGKVPKEANPHDLKGLTMSCINSLSPS